MAFAAGWPGRLTPYSTSVPTTRRTLMAPGYDLSVSAGCLAGRMSTGVTARRVREKGLVGVLCEPHGTAPAPGVLLLGGSEGGVHERDARVLAGDGFTVLTVAYFGAPGLPPGLVDVPLEYFFRGLDLLASRPRARTRLGVVGGSRGAEAALLVAAHDARVAA